VVDQPKKFERFWLCGVVWGRTLIAAVPPVLATIVHLDADAFFVSCELALKPQLRGTKCAVGGRQRGIISSASYEARACGVYTPMPTQRALKVCPDLILLPHTSGLYAEISAQMFDLCETLTPVVQRNSIDEGYLDLAPCGFADSAVVARSVRGLQERLGAELQIPVSFGIAANKLVAQIASKLRKPRGFVVVPPGRRRPFSRRCPSANSRESAPRPRPRSATGTVCAWSVTSRAAGTTS
jgi:DNA polymerase-4